MAAGSSSYVVQTSTLRISTSSMSVVVLNTKNNVNFLLQVYGLQHSMFRVKFTEKDPIRERYEIPIGLSLVAEPVQEE